MSYLHNFQDSHKFAQQVLGLMTQHQIPATPQNYEIWFAYVGGQIRELNKILDKILRSGRGFTQDMSDEIYEAHFSQAKRISDSMMNVGDRMQDELDTLVENIQNANRDASAYGSTLQAASGELTNAKGPAAVQSMIDGLVGATKQMEERNKRLELQLEASTQEVGALRTNLEEVRHEALTDQLTGLANGKAFDNALNDATSAATQEGQNLSLLFSDIDHFKKFNDTWGHQTGDNVLRLVAKCLQQNVKGRDTAARYGGEEFALILPETSLNDAVNLGNQIRKAVKSKHLQKKSTGEDLGTITISIGAATFKPGEEINAFVHRADSCLYAAKRAGRNRVVSENDEELKNVEDLAKGAA